MITLHGLKACDTCRKAMKELKDSGLDARLRDLREVPLVAAQAEHWLETLGSMVLNTRSTTWRGLSQEVRSMPPSSLLIEYPALVKRPVVESPEGLFLGWTHTTRAAIGLRD